MWQKFLAKNSDIKIDNFSVLIPNINIFLGIPAGTEMHLMQPAGFT